MHNFTTIYTYDISLVIRPRLFSPKAIKSQKSRSILQDRSTISGMFWKRKPYQTDRLQQKLTYLGFHMRKEGHAL